MPSKKKETVVEPRVFTRQQFCQRYQISLTKFHDLQKKGRGPRVMLLGKKVVITHDSAREWEERMEADAVSHDVQLERARRVEISKLAGKTAGQSPLHVCRQKQGQRNRKRP